jgi:hypothetical protein
MQMLQRWRYGHDSLNTTDPRMLILQLQLSQLGHNTTSSPLVQLPSRLFFSHSHSTPQSAQLVQHPKILSVHIVDPPTFNPSLLDGTKLWRPCRSRWRIADDPSPVPAYWMAQSVGDVSLGVGKASVKTLFAIFAASLLALFSSFSASVQTPDSTSIPLPR